MIDLRRNPGSQQRKDGSANSIPSVAEAGIDAGKSAGHKAWKNRILLVSPPDSIHTIRLHRSLVERGYAVDVAARRIKGIASIQLGESNDKEESISRMADVLSEKLSAGGCDIVHAHFATRYGHVLGSVPKEIKKVLTVWGEDVLDEALWSALLRDRLLQGLESADHITTTSQHMKETLMDNYQVPEDKLWIIPFGYQPSFRPKSVGDDFYAEFGLNPRIPIVASARVCRPQNNIEQIVDVFMHNRLRMQLVVLTGQLSEEKYVVMLKEKSKQDKRIIFLDTLDDDNLSSLYNASQAILSIPHVDQLSTTVLESLACGTPVICSDIPVYHERVIDGKNGLFVNISDDIQILNAIALFEEKRTRYSMSVYARQSVANDSWEITMRMMTELYEAPRSG